MPQIHRQQPALPLELETRNGLSLARNDAVATIAGSVFPACPFVPTLEIFASPFGPKLSARFGFDADTGRIRHSEPVALSEIQRSCDAILPPLPFGFFAPYGSKRSTGLIA
jgi:hypothetical protein